MIAAPTLHWLPDRDGWRAELRAFRERGDQARWADAVALANARLDFVRTNLLDAAVRSAWGETPPADAAGKPVRLALLGSSTLAHLHPGLRIAALRRGLHLTLYEADYGQYRQELTDGEGALQAFAPNAVLFAFDAWHVSAGVHPGLAGDEVEDLLHRTQEDIAGAWRLARERFGCPVLQQTVVPAFGPLMGNNEHRLPGSRAEFVRRLNGWLREAADDAGVELVALDQRIALDGLGGWHDVALWRRSKQEITPAAAPMYGELVARTLAALQGRVSKCLVLDLDNTLWGGVIGDDGWENLVLGEGSAAGEAFLAIQAYAKDLSGRGVVLAVCSKNDEANALEAFERHPEMVLRRDDIACFVANWTDKASNLREIAARLSLGIESLVFLDDNPAERDLVRRELPMVAVPELAEDPAYYPRALMDAGYFEAVRLTEEDRTRSEQYQGNARREAARADATDMQAYLRGLEMRLVWRRFDAVSLARVTQLINKTNQFNLTTRRRSEEEVAAVMDDPAALGLQLRLIDRFGDNGIIAVLIGRLRGPDLWIDTWLMSCRVLGRDVEGETLKLLAREATEMGAERLVGEFRPTAKNGMVRDLYARLGFAPDPALSSPDASVSVLDLQAFTPACTTITLQEAA